MRKFILFASLCSSTFIGLSQHTLKRDQLVLMEYSNEHAHIDSQAVKAFQLDSTEINTLDSLIISTVNYYNVQVTRGSLSLAEKTQMDSLSALQADFREVHKRKLKYRKRRMAKFSINRQNQIRDYGANKDSLYKIMLKLYTKSMKDRQQKVVHYAGMGSDTIDLPNYARQYMPYINQKDEHIVYAICSRDFNHYEVIDPSFNVTMHDLKKEFMSCGDCYEGLIHIKINLDKKEVILFHTN